LLPDAGRGLVVKRSPDRAGDRARAATWTIAILLWGCGSSVKRLPADAALDIVSTPGNRDGATERGGPHPDATTTVACRLSSDCADVPSTFCQKDSCDPSAIGTCAIIPGTRETGFCQPETDFVCGCDGKTYDYPCLAHAQSVNIASSGPCPLPDGGGPCGNNADCGTGLYCKKASCGAATGVCAGEPDFNVCYEEVKDAGYSPACGCDHKTYDDDCMAASYGVSVDFEGECPPLPSGPCTSQADCGGASYAALVYCRPTVCGAPSGVCTAFPVGCSQIYQPVCGCDGHLYGNACGAEEAGLGWYDTDGGCP
jgi:Kazal-type serine protease inhibitor domain